MWPLPLTSTSISIPCLYPAMPNRMIECFFAFIFAIALAYFLINFRCFLCFSGFLSFVFGGLCGCALMYVVFCMLLFCNASRWTGHRLVNRPTGLPPPLKQPHWISVSFPRRLFSLGAQLHIHSHWNIMFNNVTNVSKCYKKGYPSGQCLPMNLIHRSWRLWWT